MSIIVSGQRVETPGFQSINHEDDPELRSKMPEDGRRQLVDKTASCCTRPRAFRVASDRRPQVIRPGLCRDDAFGRNLIDIWSSDGRCAGAHFGVGMNGVVYQFADAAAITYHATTVNGPDDRRRVPPGQRR